MSEQLWARQNIQQYQVDCRGLKNCTIETVKHGKGYMQLQLAAYRTRKFSSIAVRRERGGGALLYPLLYGIRISSRYASSDEWKAIQFPNTKTMRCLLHILPISPKMYFTAVRFDANTLLFLYERKNHATADVNLCVKGSRDGCSIVILPYLVHVCSRSYSYRRKPI